MIIIRILMCLDWNCEVK